MKSQIIFALLILAYVTCYSQDVSPAAQYIGKSITLISLSEPNAKISEEKGLCHISATKPPLKLKIVPGLSDAGLVSLESTDSPGYFLRHQNSAIKLHPFPESDSLFEADATFKLIVNPDGSLSFRSYNYPNQFISVTHSKKLFITPDPSPVAKSFKPVP